MAKKKKTKTTFKDIWSMCWAEYVAFVTAAWKDAWTGLKEALIAFVCAVFTWLKLVLGAVFGGIWKLIVLPIGAWLKAVIINLIEKI